MEGFDIYDDLVVLHEQETQKAIEDLQWKEKYQVALGTIQKLQAEKKELNRKINQLEINFVSLLDTARTEIKRKDKQICDLRREKDDICFRRNKPRQGKQFSEHADADVEKDVKRERVHVNPFSREPRKSISSNTDENLKDTKFLIKSSSDQIGDIKKKFEKSKRTDHDHGPKNSREKEKRRNGSRDRSYDSSRQRNCSPDRFFDRSRNRFETNGDKHRDQLKNRKNNKRWNKERSKDRIKEGREEEKKNNKRNRHRRSLSQNESSDGSWDRADDKTCRSFRRTNHINQIKIENTTANGYEPLKLEDKTKDVIKTSNDYSKLLDNVPKPLIEKRSNQKIEILQIEILKDVKEFKKNLAEAEKIKKLNPINLTKVTTEKSNQFLDALFDDSIMNQSEHEDLYNDLEEVAQKSHSDDDDDNTKQDNFIKTDENCNFKFQTPQKQSVIKPMDDLFGPSPAGCLCDLNGQKNSMSSIIEDSNDLDFVPIVKPGSTNKAADTKQRKADTISQLVLDDSPSDYKQKNSKEKSSERCLKLKTLENPSTFTADSAEITRIKNQVEEAKTFKFAELDSSFYSSEDENEAKHKKENLNTALSDIDSPEFEKVSINVIQTSETETICKTKTSTVEIGKNDSDTFNNDLSFNGGKSETKFSCEKYDSVEDSAEKCKNMFKDWTNTDYMEKSFKSSHAERQNQTPNNLQDNEENNKNSNLQKQSHSPKHNKSSYNSKSRSISVRDTHLSSSSRSKTEKHRRRHHHRSKESIHSKINLSSHRESPSPRKHSKKHRHRSSHDQIDMKNRCIQNKCETIIDDTVAVRSSPMLVWSDDHGDSLNNDLPQKEINIDNQDQVIFLHCVDISDDEELIEGDLDSHEFKERAEKYCRLINEKTEEKAIEEKNNSNRNENKINPVLEQSVSEASFSTVHDENKISNKSQDSEASKQVKPKNEDMPSFEYSGEENAVELNKKAECIAIPSEQAPVPEVDVPIGNQGSNIAQYITYFKFNDSPPNVDSNLSALNRRKGQLNKEQREWRTYHKVESSSAASHLKSDSNTSCSDNQLNIYNVQSGRSEKDDFIENSKESENEENNKKIETETVRLSQYEEQEKSFSEISHVECMGLNENIQEVINTEFKLEEAKNVPLELEKPKNVPAEEESYSLALLNSSKESDEKAELLRSSHPLSFHTKVNASQDLSANKQSNAKENVRIPSTKGYNNKKFLTSNGNGESPQKISNHKTGFEKNILSESLFACVPIINPIDSVQPFLGANEDNNAFDSIIADKEINGQNELFNSMPSRHPYNVHNEITYNHNLSAEATSGIEKDVSSPNGNLESPQNYFKGKQDTGFMQNLLSEKEPVRSIDIGKVTKPLKDEQCHTHTNNSTTNQSVLNSTTELDTIRSLPSLDSPKKISNSADGFDSSHSHSESVSSGRRKKIKTPRKRTEYLKKIPNTIIANGLYTESKDVSSSVSAHTKYDLSKTVPGHINEVEGNIASLSTGTGAKGSSISEKINPINIAWLEANTTHEETPDENKSETNDGLSKISHGSFGKGFEIREEQTPINSNKTATNVENESSVRMTSKNAKEKKPIPSEKALQKDQHELNFETDECYERNCLPPIKAQDTGSTNDIESTSHIESKVKQFEKLDVQQVSLVYKENQTSIKEPQENENLIVSKLDEVETKNQSFSITIKRKRTDKKCTDFVEAISKVVNETHETLSFAEDLKNDTNFCNTENKQTEVAIMTDSNENNSISSVTNAKIWRNSTTSLIDNTKAINKNCASACQEQPVKQQKMMKHFMDSGHIFVGTCNYQSSMSCSDEGIIENPTEINIKKKKNKNTKLTDAFDCDFDNSTTGSSSKINAIAPNPDEAKTRSKKKYKRKTTQNLDSSNSNDDVKKASASYIEDSFKEELEGPGLKDSTEKRKHKTNNSIICPVSKYKDNNLTSDSNELNLTAKIKSLEKSSPLSQIESDELHSSLETAKSVDDILDKLHTQNETTDLRLKEFLKKISKEFLEASGEFQGIPQFPSDESVDVIGSSSYGENEQHLLKIKRHKKATRRQKKRKLSATLDAKTEETFVQAKRPKKPRQDCPIPSPINICDPTSCDGLDINQCKSFKEQQRSPFQEKSIITAITPTHHKIFLNDVFPDDPPLAYSANDDDVQYQEIDNRMRSLFQSPSYAQSVNGESSLDQRNDDRELVGEDSLEVAEGLNQSERSECDTSISSRKVSLGPNEYVVESVGMHAANVFITRKRCKKRTKVGGSGV